MSPQGGRKASGKGGGGVAARQGLLLFGVTFVVLFLIVAISEGIGDPSIPDGVVVLVEDAPDGTGEVTQEKFDRALAQSAAQNGVKEVPKPGDPQYGELREAALNSLIDAIWLQGLGEEMGITVTDQEVADELEKLKKESFKSEKEFTDFLKEAKYTQADIDERVKLQILSRDIQEQVKEETPQPSSSEIEEYYEAGKSTQFTQKASRDVRLIVNKDRAKAEAARSALTGDNTATNWQKVAKKYSEDAATKESGGVQKGVAEGTLEEPLNKAVFDTPEGQVEGPIDAPRGFTVFEVTNSTPESVQPLKAVEPQIRSTILQRVEQETLAGVIGGYTGKWSARTFCAPGYLNERCRNYEFSPHPASAPPACYEEDPDGGRPEACPAPVDQVIPALPGTVSPLEPRGKPLAQRPRPLEGAGGEEEVPTVPGGEAVPPPSE